MPFFERLGRAFRKKAELRKAALSRRANERPIKEISSKPGADRGGWQPHYIGEVAFWKTFPSYVVGYAQSRFTGEIVQVRGRRKRNGSARASGTWVSRCCAG